MKPSRQGRYLIMRIQKVKIDFFMIFTIMFKITICESTFTKLTDKMLQGFVEVLDFIAKIVKSHTIGKILVIPAFHYGKTCLK